MTVLPTVRAGARAAGAISRHLGSEAQTQRAREYVGRELGEHLSSEEARQGLRRADEIAEEVPGFSPSLAQRTRIPALAATQESIEKQARGSELDVMVGRHQRNAKALEDYARRYAPRGDAGADAAVEPLVRARQQAAERVRAFEREKAALAKQYSPEAMAARREAIRDREREALQVLRERTTGQRQDITAGIERIDRGAVGERLRGKVQERRAEAMARMGELSAQLGLNDADVTVPYQTFYRGLQRWTDSMLPSQRDNLPGTFQDVLELGRRAAARMEAIQGQALLKGDVMGALDATPPVTFREIKALREAVTDEWLEAVRDTSPGHRKRLANVLQLRRMIDNELLGENLDTAQPGLADAYKQFRGRYLQEVIQPFERGAVKEVRRSDGTGFFRTLDEDVAAKALESQDAARQFRQVLGDDADAMADLQAVALDDLANAAVRGGVVQPRQLENWLVKRRLALEEFPEIRDTVARIARAVTDVEEAERGTKAAIMDRGLQARRGITADQNRLRQAEERLDQEMRPLLERMGALNERQMALEDTMLARRLAGIERGNQTPATLIDEAVGKPALMAKLWTQLDGQPEAQEALRRHVWDGLTKLDGAALNQFLTDNNNSLKIAFSEPHLRRLKMIADGLEMLAAVPPPTRGRPISPDPVERLKELTGADPSSMAARYLAVRRGRSSRWVEGFTGLMNLLRQRGKMASDELMKRALYDPEVAQSIADSVNLPKSKAAQSRLRGWMFAVGATGPAEEQRQ